MKGDGARIVYFVILAPREFCVQHGITVNVPPVQTTHTNHLMTVLNVFQFLGVRQENIELDTTLPSMASANRVKRERTRILTGCIPVNLFRIATQDNI